MKLYKNTATFWSLEPLETSGDLQIALEHDEIWWENWDFWEVSNREGVYCFPEEVLSFFQLPLNWGEQNG